MPIRLVETHPQVVENNGRIALMRGPLLYCFEQTDNPGIDLQNAVIDGNAYEAFRSDYQTDLLNGVVALQAPGLVAEKAAAWDDTLYRSTPAAMKPAPFRSVTLTAIPYYAWANREPGTMRIWVPYHKD